MTKSPYTIRAEAMLRRRPTKSMPTTSQIRKRFREQRENAARDFTPIEKLFIESVSVLSQISRQIGNTEPEDTVFVIALERAARPKEFLCTYDDLEEWTGEEDDEPGPANEEDGYTGI